MTIRPPDKVMAWLGPLALINVFVWIVLWTPEANQTICAKSDNCLVDWTGALSGWAAAFGALLAGWWTISGLRKQIEQQQTQIDFQLGDGSPTIQPLGKRNDHTRARFKFVNWNRRTVTITKVTATAGAFTAPLIAVEHEVTSEKGVSEYPVRPNGTLDWKPFINGWLDRSKPAPFLDFRLKYNEEDLSIFPPHPREPVTIRLTARAVGEVSAVEWQLELVMDRWGVFPISEAYRLEHDQVLREGGYDQY
ncbi:hypothetical protein ACSV9I_02840 [Rhizobium sp. G187]|uniref:hypothetical protein n=1 Tax=Rhizobium sp. G187 TaxID=3451352 RepID=UPI003EE7D355